MIQIDLTAWLQLTHKQSRLIMSIIGVTFSVVLMFVTLGLRDGLFEDAVIIHKTLDADLIIIREDGEAFWFLEKKFFPRSLIYSLSGINDVDSINPLYMAWANFKNPMGLENKPIAICAFNTDKPIFKIPEINQNKNIIQKANTFLFDRLSRPDYGPIVSLLNQDGRIFIELSQKEIRIEGLFSLGGSVFSADGMLITSDVNYANTLGKDIENISLGLVKVNSTDNIEQIKNEITQKLPDGIRVIDLSEFMDMEKRYWNDKTPIGFIFNLLGWVGFMVGGIIVYQIIFVQISDYISVYATFVAIGYSYIYIIKTVLQEAILMAVIGYIPACVFAGYLYSFIENNTRLPMNMNPYRLIIVFLLTCLMCLFGSVIAINKIRDVDPATLFT